MTQEEQAELIDCMTTNLLLLRAALNLTQTQLGNMIGLSRYTIMSIETRKRSMTWSVFLLLYLVFSRNEKTAVLLEPLGIKSSELSKILPEG